MDQLIQGEMSIRRNQVAITSVANLLNCTSAQSNKVEAMVELVNFIMVVSDIDHI